MSKSVSKQGSVGKTEEKITALYLVWIYIYDALAENQHWIYS